MNKYAKRFLLTESTKGTPCITGFLDQRIIDEVFDSAVTIHSISEDDVSPRVLEFTLDISKFPGDPSNWGPEDLVRSACGDFIDDGSDVTYKTVEEQA